jgi:hypothetical protein
MWNVIKIVFFFFAMLTFAFATIIYSGATPILPLSLVSLAIGCEVMGLRIVFRIA